MYPFRRTRKFYNSCADKQHKPDIPDQPKMTAGYVAAQGTQALTVVSNTVDKKSVKRKREDDCDEGGAKKLCGEQVHAEVNFIGFKWDMHTGLLILCKLSLSRAAQEGGQ